VQCRDDRGRLEVREQVALDHDRRRDQARLLASSLAF
jgi:hypothetical protein